MNINKFADSLFELEEEDYALQNRALQFFFQLDDRTTFCLRDLQNIIENNTDEDLKELLELIDTFQVYDSYEIVEAYIGEEVTPLLSEVISAPLTWIWSKRTKSTKKRFF